MIPDVRFAADTWIELYATTGIAPGTALVLQNKLQQNLLVYIGGATAPPSTPPRDGLDGYILTYLDPARIAAGTTAVWIKLPSSAGAMARVCVQEATS